MTNPYHLNDHRYHLNIQLYHINRYHLNDRMIKQIQPSRISKWSMITSHLIALTVVPGDCPWGIPSTGLAVGGWPEHRWEPYHTTPYHTKPYHTIPYHTIPHHTTPYHTIPYHTIPYPTIPYHTIPYHTIPYHTIPYHTIPYHIIQYHTIPYHTIPYQSPRKLCLYSETTDHIRAMPTDKLFFFTWWFPLDWMKQGDSCK